MQQPPPPPPLLIQTSSCIAEARKSIMWYHKCVRAVRCVEIQKVNEIESAHFSHSIWIIRIVIWFFWNPVGAAALNFFYDSINSIKIEKCHKWNWSRVSNNFANCSINPLHESICLLRSRLFYSRVVICIPNVYISVIKSQLFNLYKVW